jgi:mannose-6-phosphate isomerase-like protein (cupin superfamily)
MILKAPILEGDDKMGGLATKILAELIPGVPAPREPIKNPIDHWPSAILLERGAYLRKLAAQGDGSASETLSEYSHHCTMLCLRSRDGAAERHRDFAELFYILEGRATLVTGSMVTDASAIGLGRAQDLSAPNGKRQSLRAGDVVSIPAGLSYQLLVSDERPLTYVEVKILETPERP